ncbi:MAG: diguanylate cyclase [Pseudomonadota bacterium]
MDNTTTRPFLRLCGAALAYFALARFGMAVFGLKPSNITLLWLPSGIALVMCLEWGYRAIPFIIVASLCANLDGMMTGSLPATLLHTGLAAISDTLAGVLAMRLFRRFLPDGLARTSDLLPFILWVCLVPTGVSGVLLALNLASGAYIAWQDAGALVCMLVLADSLGLLLVYPVYQGWHARSAATPVQLRALAFAVPLIAGLLLASIRGVQGMEFFIVPVLLVLSFNVGLFSLTTIGALALFCLFAAAAHNAGPFAVHGNGDAHVRLLAFAFSSALTILGVALQRRQLDLTEHTRQLWQEAAEHDPLTGLLNRRAFMPKIHLEHQRCLRNGKTYAIAMLDLDHFKDINDTCGHQGGDRVLNLFAGVMLDNCRLIDTVARVGGEEFAILLPECSAEQARPILERLRGKLAALVVPMDQRAVSVTVSIGIASFDGGAEQVAEVVARADRALYRAKQTGRNRSIVDGQADSAVCPDGAGA